MRLLPIYLGGPISGLTYDQASEWRLSLADELPAHGWTGLSPLDYNGNPRDRAAVLDPWFEDMFDDDVTPEQAVHADFRMIERSSAVLFNFEQPTTTVSLGSLVELGYAYAKSKPIVVICDPSRPSRYEHPFIVEVADRVIVRDMLIPTLDDLRDKLVGVPYA